MDEVAPVVRKIGQNIAFETGIRVALSFSGRLLTGYMGGLPPTAISVNAAVAFFLSAALELPTGVVADIFGKAMSVRVGYYCQFFASLCLFGAVAIFPVWPLGMWLLIVAESVFDAFGNCLLSGAREAAYQSIIEQNTSGMSPTARDAIRQRYLSLAEAHGRVVLLAFPLVVIGSLLALDALTGLGYFAMLIVAAGWLAIDRQFLGLAKLICVDGGTGRSMNSWLGEAGRCFQALRSAGSDLAAPIFCWMINRFTSITVTCYVILAVIKNKTLWPGADPALPVLVITAVLLIGRLSRSFILPMLARRWPNERLISLGAAAQAALAAVVLFSPLRGGPMYVCALAVLVGAFDVFSGLVERPALGLMLDSVPEPVRASFLSLISSFVLLGHFFYSVRLTSSGVGIPTMPEIWILVLGGGCMMSFASVDWRILRRQATAAN